VASRFSGLVGVRTCAVNFCVTSLVRPKGAHESRLRAALLSHRAENGSETLSRPRSGLRRPPPAGRGGRAGSGSPPRGLPAPPSPTRADADGPARPTRRPPPFGRRRAIPAKQANTACASSNPTFGLAAVAGAPAKRRPPEPPRIVDQEKDEFERVREGDKVELRCGRQRAGRVPRVEGAAEASVGVARGGGIA
jgi:hypothetical protein